MELLLNLAWLLLALPAYWLWRTHSQSRRFSSLQGFLALGCLLVILFPVISATDDLRAMRAEMEESPTSKRGLRQASNDKAPLLNWQSPAAVSCVAHLVVASDSAWLEVASAVVRGSSSVVVERSPRAPPTGLLS